MSIGNYTIVTSLFFKDRDGLIQQNAKELAFIYKQGEKEEVKNELVVAAPLDDIELTENSSQTVIDLKGLFALKNGTAVLKDGKQPIEIVMLYNNNKLLVVADISDDSLILSLRADKVGEAKVTVRGSYEELSAIDSFLVTIVPAKKVIPVPVIEKSVSMPVDASGATSSPLKTKTPVLSPVVKETVVPSPIKKLVPSLPPLTNSKEKEVRQSALEPEDRLYGALFVGLQGLNKYGSAPVSGFVFGREFNSLLSHLASEIEVSRTTANHQKRSQGTVISETDVLSFGIHLVYTLHSQVPKQFELFTVNPVRIKLRLGMTWLSFDEVTVASNTGESELEKSYGGGGFNSGFGIQVANKVLTSSELYMDLSRVSDVISRLYFGYRQFF